MIVSSEVARDDHDQVDGRFWVYEKHTHDEGQVETFTWLAEAGTDFEAVAEGRTVTINETEANQPPPDQPLLKIEELRAAYLDRRIPRARQLLNEIRALLAGL